MMIQRHTVGQACLLGPMPEQYRRFGRGRDILCP
jgi:hypothetical protein